MHIDRRIITYHHSDLPTMPCSECKNEIQVRADFNADEDNYYMDIEFCYTLHCNKCKTRFEIIPKNCKIDFDFDIIKLENEPPKCKVGDVFLYKEQFMKVYKITPKQYDYEYELLPLTATHMVTYLLNDYGISKLPKISLSQIQDLKNIISE